MAIKNLPTVFDRLHMGKHAYTVYEVIRKHGPLLAAHIARRSNLHRPALYQSISQLQEKGLITKAKHGGRFLWKTTNPHRIADLFMQDVRDVQRLIPKERTLAPSDLARSSLKILKGRNDIRAVFDDVITHTAKSGTFFRYTSETDLAAVNAYLSPDYRARRDAKHLERRVISNPISGSQKRRRLERFIKFIGAGDDMFDQNIIEIIYEDRVAFIDLNAEEAIIIENAPLANFQKVIFRRLYKRL